MRRALVAAIVVTLVVWPLMLLVGSALVDRFHPLEVVAGTTLVVGFFAPSGWAYLRERRSNHIGHALLYTYIAKVVVLMLAGLFLGIPDDFHGPTFAVAVLTGAVLYLVVQVLVATRKGWDVEESAEVDSTLVAFAESLVRDHALPILTAGYADLVQQLRSDDALRTLVREQGLDHVFDGDDDALVVLCKGNKELVTAFEKVAEAAMRDEVARTYPDHAVVGEEHGYKAGTDSRWVFDPIDGTAAMIRSAMADAYGAPVGEPPPGFGITIALTSGRRSAVGVIVEFRPRSGTLDPVATWVGAVGHPTTRNGEAIVINPDQQPASLAQAGLTSTVPELMFATPERWSGFQALREATTHFVSDLNCVGFVRILEPGSAISVAYEADMAYHAAAAIVPILQGAGARATAPDGYALDFSERQIESEFLMLVAPPRLHAVAVEVIAEGVPDNRNTFAASSSKVRAGYITKFP